MRSIQVTRQHVFSSVDAIVHPQQPQFTDVILEKNVSYLKIIYTMFENVEICILSTQIRLFETSELLEYKFWMIITQHPQTLKYHILLLITSHSQTLNITSSHS